MAMAEGAPEARGSAVPVQEDSETWDRCRAPDGGPPRFLPLSGQGGDPRIPRPPIPR